LIFLFPYHVALRFLFSAVAFFSGEETRAAWVMLSWFMHVMLELASFESLHHS
jgi:hypothetical protein